MYRYSIRALLILTMSVGVSIVLVVVAYRNYIIPKTPLAWLELENEELKSRLNRNNPLLISFEIPDSGMLRHRSKLETPELRTFVFENNVDLRLSEGSVVHDNTAVHRNLVDLLFEQHYINSIRYDRFILILPGAEKLVIGESDWNAHDIMDAILANQN